MTLAWIVYALTVGALLSVAAWASERMLRSAGRQGRWTWMAAGIASVLVPLLALTGLGPDVAALFEGLLTLGEEGGTAVELPAATVVTETTTSPVKGGWSWSFVPSLSRAAELGLLGVWLLASVAVLGVYALTWRHLRRRLARWPRAELEGSPVRLTRATGPAVVGFLRPVMMVPAWIRDLPPEDRELVLRHEREHLRAGDSRLLALFPLLVALVPWNLALWWQLRRLRLAVELDCDARVLADGSEAAAYGRLLVSMSQGPQGWIGSASLPLTTAALVERKSDLERRIRTMIESRERTPALHTATLAALAGLALFVACDAPAPVESDPEAGPDAAGSVEPAEGGAETGEADGRSAGLWMVPDGNEEGAARRLPPPPQAGSVSDRPAYIPREVDPKLTNASEIEELLERRYPRALRDAGLSGRAVVWLLVGATGDVEQVRLARSSGLEALDRAAMDVARNMEFEPARDADGPLGVWISQPVSFRAEPATSTGDLQVRKNAPPTPAEEGAAGGTEAREIPADTIEGRIRLVEEPPTRTLRLEDDRRARRVDISARLLEISDDDAGENSSIQLRGITSLRAEDAPGTPLVVVDGVILGREVDLADLNALDIASIEIVKGGAAERLYGDRASNGVIQITTKDAADGGS